ncbi:MAG: hypothetical protein ACE149_12600 [Armatimonadota bacterium]
MSERVTGLLLTFARRGEEAVVQQAISRLRDEGAEQIFAVGTPASERFVREIGIDDIVLYGDGRGARSVVGGLRRRRPRLAAVVYWDERFGGHLKLELLALLAGARRVWRVAPDGARKAMGRGALVWSVLVKTLTACGCAVAGALICGAALVCLRTRRVLAGGSSANRV